MNLENNKARAGTQNRNATDEAPSKLILPVDGEEANRTDTPADTVTIVNCMIPNTGTVTADVFANTGMIANESFDEEIDMTANLSKVDEDDRAVIDTTVDVRELNEESNMIVIVDDEAAGVTNNEGKETAGPYNMDYDIGECIDIFDITRHPKE